MSNSSQYIARRYDTAANWEAAKEFRPTEGFVVKFDVISLSGTVL